MTAPDRTYLSDLRGAARLAVDATAGITRVVEKMHRTIQRVPAPFGRAANDRPTGITGLVYRSIHGTTHLVGEAVALTLGSVAALIPDREATPGRDALVSVLNGVYGDYLVQTRNPLAIEMCLRHDGRRIDPTDPQSLPGAACDKASSGRLLIMVHGLCMNDRQWNRDGHDHGTALADEFGYVPLYLRYNSGLAVGANGLAFARMLEALVDNWPGTVRELVIVGHSMGGLVARSACSQGEQAGHAWPQYLRKLVFLGTPHHGSPLERGGQGIDLLLGLSPYSAPLATLGRRRSAGIVDLGHGTIGRATNEPVPLPSGVESYAIAASLSKRRTGLSDRVVGDGLVPVHSALGRHADRKHALAIPGHRKWIGYETGHMDLLSDPQVYGRLRKWMPGTD